MTTPNLPFNPVFLAKIMTDEKVRRHLVRRSHRLFFAIYLNHYIDYKLAPFQKEMFDITEDKVTQNAIVASFRNSAKSTIMTMSQPLWAVLGEQQKKFVVIIGRTQAAAEQYIRDIKTELEENGLLKKDLGPFEDDKEWNSRGLILPWYGARIIAVSVGENIRGLRWGKYRPEMIIADDIEDREEMRSKEGRDKMERWFTGEVAPLGDLNTRIMLVGTLTHQDSLLSRLIKRVENKKYNARMLWCPLIDKNGVITWPGKFPDLAAIEAYKKQIGIDEASWQREMMLKIIPDDAQIVREEWLPFYDRIAKHAELIGNIIAVDPALGRPNSDPTGILASRRYNIDGQLHLYLLPHPVNERLNVTETLKRTEEIANALSGGYGAEIVVEEVALQGCITDQLKERGLDAVSFSPRTGKGERLSLTTPYIQNGWVHFPKQGAEELITQILGFGVEAHDDLVDAFTMLVLHAFKDPIPDPEMWFLPYGGGRSYDGYRGLSRD